MKSNSNFPLKYSILESSSTSIYGEGVLLKFLKLFRTDELEKSSDFSINSPSSPILDYPTFLAHYDKLSASVVDLKLV